MASMSHVGRAYDGGLWRVVIAGANECREAQLHRGEVARGRASHLSGMSDKGNCKVGGEGREGGDETMQSNVFCVSVSVYVSECVSPSFCMCPCPCLCGRSV